MTRATGWRWLLWVTLAAGCGESSPVDMWINRDPDAGSGFEAPVREVGSNPVDGAGGAAGGGGGAAGSSGAAGTGGSDTAGTGGSDTTGAAGTGGAGGASAP